MKKYLILLSLIISFGHSFDFIGYKSGMTKKEAIVLAYNKDKPIMTTKIFSSATEFDRTLIKGFQKSSQLKTHALLFDKNRQILLSFTKKTQILYRLDISFTGTDKPFLENFKKKLSLKYKVISSPEKTELSVDSLIKLISPKVEKHNYWMINDTSYIYIKEGFLSGAGFTISYIDNKLKNQNDIEVKIKKEIILKKQESKDMHKF